MQILSKLNNCIRNTTPVCNPRQNLRQNSVQDIIREKKFLLEKNFVQKYLSRISSVQSELSQTNRRLSSLRARSQRAKAKATSLQMGHVPIH